MNSQAQHFAAFVSPVEGHLVRRYGTSSHIGEVSSAEKGGAPGVDPSLVVPITHAEWAQYQLEYRKALDAGSLVRRTAEEWRVAETAAHHAEVERVKASKASTSVVPPPIEKKGSDR